MCEFHGSNCNGLGDIWWTDKCIYFSSIDKIYPYCVDCPYLRSRQWINVLKQCLKLPFAVIVMCWPEG